MHAAFLFQDIKQCFVPSKDALEGAPLCGNDGAGSVQEEDRLNSATGPQSEQGSHGSALSRALLGACTCRGEVQLELSPWEEGRPRLFSKTQVRAAFKSCSGLAFSASAFFLLELL